MKGNTRASPFGAAVIKCCYAALRPARATRDYFGFAVAISAIIAVTCRSISLGFVA